MGKVVEKAGHNDNSASEYKKSDSEENFLKIEPLELKFTFQPNKKLSCYLYLTNVTNSPVAFQFQISYVNNFCIEPNAGIILPQTTCGITVEKLAQKNPPPNMKCEDKINIQSVVLTQLPTDDIKKMFNAERHCVKVHELPVVYLSTPLPLSPLPQEAYSLLTQSRISNFDEVSATELLKIDTQELKFHFEANKQISSSLKLSNMTDSHVAFKVKTTHPKNSIVRPNKGVLLPRSTCNVLVTVKAQKALSMVQSKEKFLIQSAMVKLFTSEDINWNTLRDSGILKESKLNVVYTTATESSFEDAEGSKQSPSQLTVVETKDKISSQCTKKLLQIDKQELNFPFEAEKQISCSINLSNKTENHVAFKVKTTQPQKYYVRPNSGVLLPQSTCDILVTMQAQNALPELQSMGKFLIQRAVVKPRTSIEDVKWEMLKDAGLVEESKLRAVCSPETETPFEDAPGSTECLSGPSVAVDETTADESDHFRLQKATVGISIQRKLHHITSAFEKMMYSFGITSRLWIFRNSSPMHQRLLEESDSEY